MIPGSLPGRVTDVAGQSLKGVSDGRRGRMRLIWDSVKASFGFPSGVAMLAGVVVGLTLPVLDDAWNITVPVLSFDSQAAARSLLETIATATTAVAGLSFSVTVVAITLASSQLSPRVLRSFRSDRLSQTTLALFLGTFVYSLTLLVRLGVSGEDAGPPNLSVTLAVLLAFAAFGTFALFIAHILRLLQPSSVISSVKDDAVRALVRPYPSGPGEPEDEPRAALAAASAMASARVREVRAMSSGYLTVVDAHPLIQCATDTGAVVRQSARIGDYVLTGQVIAETGLVPGEERSGGSEDEAEAAFEKLEQSVHSGFVLGKQRTLVQDTAFPVRQLADIALKGLSPGINDPTTAENAIDAMASFLVEFTMAERPSLIRVDEDDEPRLIAVAPDLDDLLRLGFDQVRIAAADHPTISARMLVLLARIGEAAELEDVQSHEVQRQRRLIEPNAR